MEEKDPPVPSARFTRYLSRRGRKGAKNAEGNKEEGKRKNLTTEDTELHGGVFIA